ncbi:MAG: RNA-binding protein [Lentisphaeraceae bacterium]|nr:RNA-binding protein [Lentisphaeraceae bacterium]
MKLLIRNLARTTTDEELKKKFEVYGKVQACNIVKDKETGESKGFGFVEVPKVGDAKAAIKKLNGTKLDGNVIRVKKADTKVELAKKTSTDSVDKSDSED